MCCRHPSPRQWINTVLVSLQFTGYPGKCRVRFTDSYSSFLLICFYIHHRYYVCHIGFLSCWRVWFDARVRRSWICCATLGEFILRSVFVESVVAVPLLVQSNLYWAALYKAVTIYKAVLKFLSLNYCNSDLYKRSPLLSGRGHPLLSPNELFVLSLPVLNGHFYKRKPLKYGDKYPARQLNSNDLQCWL